MKHKTNLSRLLSNQYKEGDIVRTKMLYVSERFVNSTGRYVIRARFTDISQGDLYVQGGTFVINQT